MVNADNVMVKYFRGKRPEKRRAFHVYPAYQFQAGKFIIKLVQIIYQIDIWRSNASHFLSGQINRYFHNMLF